MTDWYLQACGEWRWSAYSLCEAEGDVVFSRVTDCLNVVPLCCVLNVNVFLP